MSSRPSNGWVLSAARLWPNNIAVIDGDQRFDYRTLADRVMQLAARLVALGVGPGSRVATLMSMNLRFVEIFHAAEVLGATLVALNPKSSRDAVAGFLRDTDPAVVLVGSEAVGDAAFDNATLGSPAIEDLGMDGAASRGTTTSPSCRVLDAERDLDAVPLPASHRAVVADIPSDSPQAIVFTSGTTKRPKGVLLSRANQLASVSASGARLGHDGSDVWLACLPGFHVGGLAILVRAVHDGAAVQLMPRFDAEGVVDIVAQREVTMVSLVPTMLRRLIGGLDGHALRCALVGGAYLAPELARSALEAGLPVSATYGLSEACSQVATTTPGSEDAAEGTCGRPLDGTRVRIGPAADETPGATDHASVGGAGVASAGGDGGEAFGEIWIAGPTVSSGYWHRPEESATTFANGWLRTGDLGRLDERGRLVVHARRDELIVTGGENVAPVQVEVVLEAAPNVAEAAVLGIPDAEWGQLVVALIVLAAGSLSVPEAGPDSLPQSGGGGDNEKVLAALIDEHCRQRLATFQRPRRVIPVRELPRTASGKLRRELLPALWVESVRA